MADRAHPARGRRRAAWRLLGGAVVLAAAIGAAIWWPRPAASRARPTPPDVAAASSAAPDPAQNAAAPVPVVRRRAADLPFDDLPDPVRRFLESTPYPASSGRLTRAHEDLLHPNARSERHRPIPDSLGEEPPVTWLFTADRWAYVGPETARVWLEVRRGDEPVPVEIVTATATREGDAGRTGTPEPLDFRRVGDRLEAELPLARFADHFGPIVLDVRFAYGEDRTHDDVLRIVSTPLDHVPGRVAGGVADRVVGGSLVVDVPVDLQAGGFYRFDANLYDASGEPVAFMSWKGELPPGAQSVPLEVYGKVLRDAGVPGPYEVGEIRGYRFLDGQYPDRELLPAVADRFDTQAWPLEHFTDAPHVSEHELHMADLMLADLEAGLPLVAPPAANDAVVTRPPDDDAAPR